MAEELTGKVVAGVLCAEVEIKKGDTLGAIASKFKTTVPVIAALNNISDPNRILAGQKLYVPCMTAKL